MQAYRFETRVSKNGIIKLPSDMHLPDREVEIIILPKENINPNKKASVDFINRWAGFLSGRNIADSKLQYLNEKYK